MTLRLQFDGAAPSVSDIFGRSFEIPDFVRMHRESTFVEPLDIAVSIQSALSGVLAGCRVGSRLALAVGSRGISGLPDVVRECVRQIQAAGCEPIIVPAMGSHGGATAEGQRQVLSRLGVDESSCGAPIIATMETVDLGEIEPGLSAHLDAVAADCDGIIVINRIKSHTSFTGYIESGLAKMIAIGLGKQRGAEQMHALGPGQLERRIIATCSTVLASGLILGGIALVEDGGHQLRSIEFVEPAGIAGPHEHNLLERAKGLEARLPISDIDVLVVDVLGKDKSGTGIDTNVIGRRMIRGVVEATDLNITNIVVLGISAVSAGNATGVGLADFVTAKVMKNIDIVATYMNSLTAGLQGVQRAQLPVVLATDRDAIEAACMTAALAQPALARIVRIQDTLSMADVIVSTAMEAEFSAKGYVREPLEGPVLTFDDRGNISAW